jgi:hypothetical protein
MPSSTKTLDSWVIGGRHRHHRTRDHFGADSDLYITIEQPIGPWGSGTPVKYVLEDLYARMATLTSATRNNRVASLNAFVLAPSTTSGGRGVKPLNAIVFKNVSNSITLNCMVTKGGFATVDAVVASRGTLYLNAFVI